MSSVAEIFGATLQRLRSQQGLTQSHLGVLARTSHTFIRETERGWKPPNLELVVSIARALRVGVEELLSGLIGSGRG